MYSVTITGTIDNPTVETEVPVIDALRAVVEALPGVTDASGDFDVSGVVSLLPDPPAPTPQQLLDQAVAELAVVVAAMQANSSDLGVLELPDLVKAAADVVGAVSGYETSVAAAISVPVTPAPESPINDDAAMAAHIAQANAATTGVSL